METTFPLRLREVIPYFGLPSNKGKQISLWDYKQRFHLVIIFHHGGKCYICRKYLKDIDSIYDKVQKLNAEVLAISSEPVSQLKQQAREVDIPFPMLADTTGETSRLFTYWDEKKNSPFPSIFICDRFGELRRQEIATEADQLMEKEEVLSWLLLLEKECPECSHL
ncbi:MAG: peroxiredoxin family protein [Candidatus Bathyarchaeota archaeon]|nr:peroxiredoxin family protein [Candidatus Bathyarchaeota archaeon]